MYLKFSTLVMVRRSELSETLSFISFFLVTPQNAKQELWYRECGETYGFEATLKLFPNILQWTLILYWTSLDVSETMHPAFHNYLPTFESILAVYKYMFIFNAI